MKVKKYKLLNTGPSGRLSKCPYNYNKNKPLVGYNKMSVSSLYASHDESKNRWGILLGEHELFKYHLIALDFDINSKNGIHEPTKILFDEYMTIGNKNGMYKSSTEGNYNVLIDIYHSKKVKKIIDNFIKINKKKVLATIHNIEIFFDGSYIIIPPTATTCKVNSTENPRKFLTNIHIHEICDENDPIEQFLIQKLRNELEKTHAKFLKICLIFE